MLFGILKSHLVILLVKFPNFEELDISLVEVVQYTLYIVNKV